MEPLLIRIKKTSIVTSGKKTQHTQTTAAKRPYKEQSKTPKTFSLPLWQSLWALTSRTIMPWTRLMVSNTGGRSSNLSPKQLIWNLLAQLCKEVKMLADGRLTFCTNAGSTETMRNILALCKRSNIFRYICTLAIHKHGRNTTNQTKELFSRNTLQC